MDPGRARVSRRTILPTMLLGLLGGSKAGAQSGTAPATTDPGLLFVDAAARAAPGGQALIRTTGYREPGVGAATYRETRTQGETPFRFRISDGRWFELLESTPDTFMFGGIGDGVHDDTAALRAQHDYCLPRGLPMLLPVPPLSWRTTDTISSRIGSWRGLGERVRWRFDPPAPEAIDMRPCLRIEASVSGVLENLDFQGPHRYDPRISGTYVLDASQGPYSDDGGWYSGFFKPGCCAIYVAGASQPILRGIWTSGHGAGSFKVGLCLDTDAGHVEIGSGCHFYDLIGVRIIRNSDDYKFRGEPVITSGFCAILFGTSDLNHTFNGGMGLRQAEFYAGQSPYGILQMHDHGARGAPLPNPALPVNGLYGSLDGSFFEFIGEAALQTLPSAVCRGLTYSDMERFSWEERFALPVGLLPVTQRQRAAFRIGQLSSNCRFGTVRVKPSYVASSSRHPDACSLLIQFSDADASTSIAQPLLATTRVLSASPGGGIYLAPGRALHAGDLTVASDFLSDGNLLHDPFDVTAWNGPPVSLGQADAVPPDMRLELGGEPACLVMPAGRNRSLPFIAAPDRSIVAVPSYVAAWINIAQGRATFRVIVDDPAKGEWYAFTSPQTKGWTRLVISGGTPSPSAALRFEIEVRDGSLRIAGLMAGIGRPRAFNRANGPTATKPLHAAAGAVVTGRLALDRLPVSRTAPAPGSAASLPASPAGYLPIVIDGTQRWLPYY